MATEDDEIYNDTPSNESVRDVRLIRKMFEVGTPKSDNSVHGKPTKLTARGINGIDPKPPAKQHPVPSTPGKKGGTVPAVPSKTAVPPKSLTPSKVVPQPPKINQKSSVASTNHLGATKTRTSGTVSSVTDKGIRPVLHNGTSSVPHNGTGGDKNIFQSILRRNNPSAATTTTSKTSITSATQPVQALKISPDMIRISEISGDRSTVYPPNGFSEVSPQRQPSKGSTGYCAVSPNRSHPKSPLTGKMSVNLVVSANKKTYRKLPVPTTRTPAPRKKPLPPELPKNFAQKFMADMKMAKKVGARISTERESELLSYDDIYEDVSEYVNQNN